MNKSGGIIIKETAIKILADNDLELISVLQSLKVPRNVAALITYLANVTEATSREIEVGTNKRQPEVSIAMRALRNNSWVEEHEIKAKGKGRPVKVYKLIVPLDKIVRHFEDAHNRESAKTMASIQRLKDLTAT
jgi:predicted transcriptional regulator